MSIQELLEIGVKRLKNKNIEEPIFISRLLMSFTIRKDRVFLVTNSEKELTKQQEKSFLESIEKVENHIPIQYITNNQEFMKMNFYVDENVLIPRQDTEVVAEEAINIIKNNNFKDILDMCTGSGILAVSIAKYIKNCNVSAVDVSQKAIEVAKKNAILNGVNDKIKFIHSNMFENVNGKFDVIISNPPYIKSKVINSLSENVKKEPILALDGGTDGLKFYKILANNAYQFLKPEGYLILEIGYDQKEEVTNLLMDNYQNITCINDMGENDRVIICKKDR